MKTVLATLNSKFVHTSLSLRYIAKYVQKQRIDAEICEYTINNTPEKTVASLFLKNADIYGFSLYIFNREETFEVIKSLKKVLPSAIIFCGGPEASEEGEALLSAYPEIDFLVRGEGEKADLELLCLAEKVGCDVEKMKKAAPKSTSFFLNGVYIETEKLPLIENLNEIPFPYEKEELFSLSERILYYESSRGCPFGCSYCMSALDKKVRAFSLERVFCDIDAFLEAGVKLVKFVDRTFNYDKERTHKILSYIMQKDNGKTEFHFEISLWLLSAETLALLKGAREGLFRFEIGIQSANKKTLDAVNRKVNIFDYEPIFAELKKTKLHLHTDLIAGLPYEDYNSFLTSLDKAFLLGGDVLQLGFLKVIHGAPISKERDFEIVTTSLPPYEILQNRWISYPEILRLKGMEEILEIYYNSALTPRSFAFAVKEIFSSSLSKMLLYLLKESEKTDFFSLPKKPRELFRFFAEKIGEKAENNKKNRFLSLLTYDYFYANLYSGEEAFLISQPQAEIAKNLLYTPEKITEKLPTELKAEFTETEPKKWMRRIKALPLDIGEGEKTYLFIYMSKTVVIKID